MKIAGILFISFSAFYCGFCYSENARLSHRYLEALLKLVRFIRCRIDCFNSPLDCIYSDFSDDLLDGTGFTDLLRQKGFSAAVSEKKDSLFLSDDVYRILLDFSSELGKSFSDEQLRHCDICISLLSDAAARSADELPVKCKTARTVSAALSAMTVILLI